MFLKIALFVVCTVFVVSDSSFVDTLGKCKIDDAACQKDLLQSIVRDIAKTGVEELGIPQLDPLKVSNISMGVMNIVDMTLIEGTAKGAKDCVVLKFETNVEAEKAVIEMICDFNVKGRYKVFSNSPLVKSFIGGENLNGEGNGKVKIDKFKIKADFDFFIQKKGGDFYIKMKSDKVKYTYNIGKMQFYADSIYIGKQESSKLVTGLLNDNWRTFIGSFGKPFMDRALDIVVGFLKNFFDSVPASRFISDDLSKYAREDA